MSETAAAQRAAALRDVLMVAYHYAPAEHAGTRRAGAFAKYLPAAGYRPLVLTTTLRGSLADDAARGIVRADELIGLLARPYRALRLRRVPAERRANTAVFDAGAGPAKLLMNLMIPDINVTWHPLAVRKGLQLIRQGSIRLIFSTSPPPTAHLVALSLKRRTGLPWVADFRDGWMFEPPNPVTLNSAFRRRVEAALERRVVLGADRIVTVNQAIAGDLAARYPSAAAKIVVITNGYDPEIFAGLERTRAADGRFRIVHTGSLSQSEASRSIDGLLGALRRLQTEASPLIDQLELVLVGNLSSRERETIAAAGLERYFTITGPVDYRQALQQQIDADLLLLVTAGGATSVTTSKLFEYLVSGRPILGLTGRTPAAALIGELEAGMVVPPDDVAGITAALSSFHARWRAGQLPTRADRRVERFSRPHLTGELAALFDQLLSQHERIAARVRV